MTASASLRGATAAAAAVDDLKGLLHPDTLSAAVSNSGPTSTMELTDTEGRIIWWRNIVLLVLSLVVGTSTVCAILR